MDEAHKCNVRFQAKVTCADMGSGEELERKDQEELLGV